MALSSSTSNYKYSIKGVFKGHTSDVRVVKEARVPDGGFITGSRDTLVKLWVPTGENIYKDEHVFIGATKFIASLCALPVSTQYPDGLILAGSNDCSIYGFTLKSQYPVMKLLGHSNVVCSLSAGFGLFVSGSWDGTARVWSGQNCTAILEGHNQTVWATEVYPLQNIILTGSADHTIRIWRDGHCEKVLYGHEDCVRGLVIIQDMNMNILSCSNDSTVRLWNIQGECLNIYQSHDNYIYGITLLNNGVDFATCSEDEHVKIWRNGNCVQSIQIASKTLWSIACLRNGDLVVGCSDGSVYLLGAEKVVSEYNRPYGEGETGFEQSISCIRGFQWNNTTKKWVSNNHSPTGSQDSDLGMDKLELDIDEKPEQKKEFEFYLDIEDKLCKLQFNRNDNPYDVALNFIAEYALDPACVTHIMEYITKNTPKLPPRPTQFFPVTRYYTYTNANVLGLKNKLLEFSQCVPKSQHIPAETIEKLILVANVPEEVTGEQMLALDTALTWSDEYLYPALDLLRLAVRCKAIGAKVGNQSFINHSLHILRTTEKAMNRVLIIKVLCNLFNFPEGEELMIKFQLKICDTAKETLFSSDEAHKSVSSMYLNYAVAAHKGLSIDIDAICLNLVELMKVVVDSDSLYKIFIAVGTLSIANYEAFRRFDSLNIQEYLVECKKYLGGGHAIIVLRILMDSFLP